MWIVTIILQRMLRFNRANKWYITVDTVWVDSHFSYSLALYCLPVFPVKYPLAPLPLHLRKWESYKADKVKLPNGSILKEVFGTWWVGGGAARITPLTCPLHLGWEAAESWEMGICTASPLNHVWARGAFHFPKPVFFTCDRETILPVSQSFSED